MAGTKQHAAVTNARATTDYFHRRILPPRPLEMANWAMGARRSVTSHAMAPTLDLAYLNQSKAKSKTKQELGIQ